MQEEETGQVISYVEILFNIILSDKRDIEEELNTKKNGEINDYEALLQKLEAEVRQHIRVSFSSA